MKRIIQGLVLATLISTAQASAFPAGAEDVASLPSASTHADRYASAADADGQRDPCRRGAVVVG